MNRITSKQSIIKEERAIKSPQLSIYNRHFYLRGAEHQLIQAQRDNEIRQLANKPKITPASYQILSQQLQTRLAAVFADTTGRDIQYLEEITLQFDELQSIVQKMCGAKLDTQLQHFCSQLWLILGSYAIQEHIQANLLFATLRILMDPFNLSITECEQMLNQIQQFRTADTNRVGFLQSYPELQEETLQLHKFLKLWRKLRYHNPNFAEKRHSIEKPQTHERVPRISQKSNQLAEESWQKYLSNHQALHNPNPDLSQYRSEPNQLSQYIKENPSNSFTYFSKPSYHEILHQRKLEKDTLPPKVETVEQDSRVSRTARPEQIKQIVNSLYVVRERKDDIDYKIKKEQEQFRLCTFSPHINQNYSSRRSVSPNTINGFETQVGRVKKGRQEKQRKKQAIQNLGRVKKSALLSKSPAKSAAPSFLTRDAPKLILQINIDGDRVQKLSLRGDQNPHLVSKKFVHMYGLEEDMIEVLESLVQEQLANLI